MAAEYPLHAIRESRKHRQSGIRYRADNAASRWLWDILAANGIHASGHHGRRRQFGFKPYRAEVVNEFLDAGYAGRPTELSVSRFRNSRQQHNIHRMASGNTDIQRH